MDYKCRACLKMDVNFLNLFEHVQNNLYVFQMLMECTSIRIEKDDGLPANICYECLQRLNSTHDFRTMVMESDARLRDILTNSTTETYVCEDFTIVKEELPTGESENFYVPFDSNDNSVYEKATVDDRNKEPICYTTFTNLNQSDGNKDNTDAIRREIVDNINELYDESKLECNDDKSMEETIGISGTKPYKINKRDKMSIFCKLCNRSFGYRYYFDIHVRHHNGDKPFKCDICSKSFAKQFQLNLHNATHSSDKPFTCDVCGKLFRTIIHLRSHQVVHSEERPHVCNICNKSYKLEYTLKVHILRHTNEKKCVCEICGKLFLDGSSLSNHKQCHRNEKNYPCPTCGKHFISNGAMKRHLRLHSNAKTHACTYCDKRFKYRKTRDDHVLVHTGEKPHRCKVCAKTFRQSSCLARHLRIHTGETPFPCELCEAKFKYSHHLLNHMKVHKKDIQQE